MDYNPHFDYETFDYWHLFDWIAVNDWKILYKICNKIVILCYIHMRNLELVINGVKWLEVHYHKKDVLNWAIKWHNEKSNSSKNVLCRDFIYFLATFQLQIILCYLFEFFSYLS